MIIRNTNGEGLQRLGTYIRDLANKQIVVGVTAEHNARPDGGSNALIGAVHEFGSPSNGIPERSWLRSTMMEQGDKYARLMAENVPQAIANGTSAEVAYNKVGETAANDVKVKIGSGNFTPLKQATIDRKGSSKPLIDDGHFRRSISHEVR